MSAHRVIVVFIEEDGNAYHAFCPVLPGLHVGGDTKQETVQNAEDAVHIYLQSMRDHGETLVSTMQNVP